MQSSTHHNKYNQSQSHAYASKVLDFAIAVGRISEVDMLASKYFLELQTKLSKTSKCRLEGSREIQSICNRRLIGKKFGVLQLRLVGLQRSPFMVNFTHIEVALCICVICNQVLQLLIR